MINPFIDWTQNDKASIHEVFPSINFTDIVIPNMSVDSDFFGSDPQHEDLEKAKKRLAFFQAKNPKALLANGYCEERSFYNTKRFERTVNNTTEYRNIHLGTDFWLPEKTAVHTPFDGEVVISHHNDYHKDYGPLLVLKHLEKGIEFHTLYGHLSIASLAKSPKGKKINKGECIAFLGNENENGHWLPHLHFQIITDLLGETENYNGVAFPSEIIRWKQLCPDPSLIFMEDF